MNILVVEDDLAIARPLCRGLEGDGFTVSHTADGRAAIRLASTRPFDAIVLDVMLPGVNGFRVCQQLRRTGVTTPVLMLTARDAEGDEAAGLELGADDYLTKPYSYRVLVLRLRALMRRSTTPDSHRTPAGLLRAADLWLDPTARRAGRGAEAIDLTGREFAVLACLMRRPGHVVSRQTILDEAWEMTYRGQPGIVEVYISQLRRKIDQPFGTRSITTVRGHGYRLDTTRG
ncbi:response regulator transcription factor [Streptomyces sp. NPDC050848]|uniref:response regulator transcription factor n=1 Tax=Streptomyces sp. NPDC050848 TaxID=3155791 RepID=UPI0033FF156E